MRMVNNRFKNENKNNDNLVNYDAIESMNRNKSKQSQNKTSRKGKRRQTNDQFKMYAKPPGIQFQVSPIPANNMVWIKFQEGMNISHLTNNKPLNHFTKRINARRNLTNANASMLSGENPSEMFNVGRTREANESAAPNIIIYQKFKLSIGNKKKRTNRFKINQSINGNQRND